MPCPGFSRWQPFSKNKLVYVACTCESAVAGVLVELAEFAAVLLQLDVGRVADHHIKAVRDAEHVCAVEPVGLSVLVVGNPAGNAGGVGCGQDQLPVAARSPACPVARGRGRGIPSSSAVWWRGSGARGLCSVPPAAGALRRMSGLIWMPDVSSASNVLAATKRVSRLGSGLMP